MFRRKSADSIAATKLSSLIASGVGIVGDVHIADGLRIDGEVRGDVASRPDSQGLLVLSEKGRIVGDVRVYDAVINGTVQGNLEVEHFLELQSNARVTGDIRYLRLKLECGARVDGRLQSVAETASAPVAGNVLTLPMVGSAAG